MAVTNNNLTENDCRVDLQCNDTGVSESITNLQLELRDVISQHADIMSTAITKSNSLGWEQGLFAIFIVIISAFSAYVFNRLYWKTVTKREKVSNLAKSLISIVEELESISIKYWTQTYESSIQTDLHALEISMKSRVLSIIRYSKIFDIELKKINQKYQGKELEKFKSTIFDIVTGGEFESRTRKSSNKKAFEIANECSKIVAFITASDCINL